MKREASFLYSALAPLVGAVITLMSSVNSRFSAIVGNLVATAVIHAAGLAAVSAVLLVKREKARPGRLPLYYYLGGFIGVGTVFSSIYAFTVLGAALAVALALLGQTLCSIVVDASGFLGRPRYPLSVRRLPGTVLAIAGVAVMSHVVDIGIGGAVGRGSAGSWHLDPVAMLVALVAGMLPAVTFSLNSELGRRKGAVHSTQVNYIVGLATTLVIAAAVRPGSDGGLPCHRCLWPRTGPGGRLSGCRGGDVHELHLPAHTRRVSHASPVFRPGTHGSPHRYCR